jgi:NCAIR mutase (PurE)-related protein
MNVDQELRDLEAMVATGNDGMTMLREFVQADIERKELADRLKEAERRCEEMQQPILEYFMQTGMENVRVDGRLVHIVKRHKVVPAEGKTKDDVCEALRHTGHADLVTTSYHWTRMSSLVKQAEEEGVELPEELLDTIKINEEFKVQTRR